MITLRRGIRKNSRITTKIRRRGEQEERDKGLARERERDEKHNEDLQI